MGVTDSGGIGEARSLTGGGPVAEASSTSEQTGCAVQEIRVGLLGAGALGAVHAASLERISGARLAVVASHEMNASAQALAARAGAQRVQPSEIFDPTRVDVLVVATPTDTHAGYAAQAIAAGLPLFLEKPAARTLAEAEGLLDRAGTVGAQVAVGHVVRYFPEYVAAQEAVSGGVLGAVQTARMRRLNAAPVGVGSWYGNPARSGGVLLDMAIHDIDFCLWAFGPAERVYCLRNGEEQAQVVAITLRHHNGVIAYIDASWREDDFSTELEISGTLGVHRVTGSGAAGFHAVHGAGHARTYVPTPADLPVPDDPYVLELKAALDWFRGGPPPRATLAEACDALRVVEAAEVSIASGTPQSVEVAA